MESTDNSENIDTRHNDIIERGVKRELPCKLTEAEELRIGRQMVRAKAALAETEQAWEVKAKKHKQEVADASRAIQKMEREMHDGQQDRIVICNRVFERNAAGGGDEVLIRLDPAHQLPGDTREVQRIPASASVMQRFLPFIGDANAPGRSVLDDARAQQAAAAQRSAAPADDVPGDVPGDDVPPDDAGEGGDEDEDEDAPSDKPKKPKPEKFDAAMLADGRCGLLFPGSAEGCSEPWPHKLNHKSSTHRWKARRPKPPQAAPEAAPEAAP